MPKTVRDLRSTTDAWLKGPVQEGIKKFQEGIKKFRDGVEKFKGSIREERGAVETYKRNFWG